MKRIFILFLSIQICTNLNAQIRPQSGVKGNNPIDIQWRALDTKVLKIIFPAGNEKEALRIANIINFISDSASVTVGDKRKHLTMVLQTNQAISNGYVGLAPYRSELYATGIQNLNWLGSINWLDVLSFHEYRHALQFINGRTGFTNFLYYIGGETFWQLAQATAIPNWYFEGDAVQTETVLSGAGRGRTPFFFQEQRALLLNDINYGYQKARNGSFKSMLPDHYRLGYAMLNQLRGESGPDVWRKILRDAGAYKGIIYPFSRAMKRHTGYNAKHTYLRTYDSLRLHWENELKTIELSTILPVTTEPKRYVTYYDWPHLQSDGSIVARRESYNRTQEVVQIKDGEVKTLAIIGLTVTEPFLSVRNNVAAWTELTTDPRWINRNYSDLVTYNINSGEKKKVTTHSKLFSPEYSSKRKQIVAVRSDQTIRNNIVLIDAENGSLIETIPNSENDFLSYPKWSRDDKSIIFITKRGSYVFLSRYDLETKTFIELTEPSEHVIEGINIGKEHVYYSASYSGINNLFSVTLDGTKIIKQLSSVKFGMMAPFVNENEDSVYFTQLGFMGNRIDKMAINNKTANTYSIIEPSQQSRYRIITTAIESKIENRIPQNNYEIKEYKGAIRTPKLHSWSLFGNQTELSLTLSIDNVMNDFGAKVKVGRNFNEQSNFVTGYIDFAKYYVPFGLNASVNGRTLIEPTNLTDTGIYNQTSSSFTEAIYGGGLSIPLTWYRGIYTTTLRVYGNGGLIKTSDLQSNDSDLTTSLNLTVIDGGIEFTNLRAKARQNLMPRFGQEFSAYLGTSVSKISAQKIQLAAGLYLPALMRNHGLKIEGGYKIEEIINDYRFFDNFKHARGYTPLQGDNEWVISVNYALPISYPDFGLVGIVYFKRIRANIFADFSEVKRESLNKTFAQNSVGTEILFDMPTLNWLQLSFGARFTSLLNTNYFDNGTTFVPQFFMGGTF